MFNHLGLFKNVPCPEDDRCGLLNCIFLHADKDFAPVNVVPLVASTPAPETIAAAADEEPVRKRRRIDGATEARRPLSSSGVKDANPKAEDKEHEVVKGSQPTQQVSHENAQNLSSATKAVSPPPVPRRSTSETAQGRAPLTSSSDTAKPIPTPTKDRNALPQRQIKKEPLNPRHIARPPASHTVRMSILTKLHDAMVQLNKLVIKENDPSKKALVLSPDELVAMALDEEEKAAKENHSVYANVIKLRITKLRKMTREEWEKNVSTYIVKFTAPVEPKPKKPPVEEVETGLKPQEEIAVLSEMHASRDVLGKAGYVLAAPTNEEVETAELGAKAADGWEQCERCNGRFQVFPGRREDGILASGGPCTYHHSKPLRPQKKKTDHITGHKESYYPCCKETVGTSGGCTTAQWHVFKVSEVKRLAAVLQFKETPRQPNKPTPLPVCFDCEMGYTTLGLELIRLTAISWPEGKKLLDILVKPIGEVLDLNSRYSGVRPEHFANAIPHGISSTATKEKPSPEEIQPLPVVSSPSEARDLLFQLIQPETPLIGHALENDLNVCRIIHPTIIDTALLYRHPAGLPYRFGLRTLARNFLGRHIQTGGGEQGHDSMEDARATGDLVRVKVKETWKALQRAGYSFENGKLVAPPGKGVTLSADGGVLGKGAGLKRKEGE
ncbi:hypothetical protein AJ79_07587 [Helicocarpus griseus UAMH5409]|uniref:Exonuclease domain-containing protein n=1 Tax=Helicocarpus griseus UAMH5409 TaxID=1447875 RepID=A0A2B7X1C3_9EURO|nr:hypothetical protein AJ79_07587 [Helicocarpus griseus UAMH5409]